MRRHLSALAVLGALVVGVGCSGDDDASSLKASSDGRLTGDPPLLTFRDVSRQKSAPARTVMSLLFYGQWGSTPNVVALYDRRVRRAVPGSLIASAYSFQRLTLAGARPRIVFDRPSGRGRFVGVEMLSKTAPPVRDSFLLRRRRGQWLVAYDTFLDRSLLAYINSREGGESKSDRAKRLARKRASQVVEQLRFAATDPQGAAAARAAARGG